MSEQAVAQHYSQGELERRIVDALTTMGADPEHLDSDQLAPVDEFHIGGRRATVELVGQLDLRPGLRVLDVGSGLGGTARYLARRHAVEVTGLDLTEEYVRVAASVPWAATSATSFLAEPTQYRELLATAGLSVQTERDRRIFGIDFFREMQVRIARDGLPALGLHIVMGPDAALKIANLVDNMERAVVAPTEMVCAEPPTTSLPHSSRVRRE